MNPPSPTARDLLRLWYRMLHLVVDALCLLAGIAILLWRGFPRLATIAERCP